MGLLACPKTTIVAIRRGLARKKSRDAVVNWGKTAGKYPVLPEEVMMSTTQSTPNPALSKEVAEWLLSILDDEDWEGGLLEGVPVTREEALRVASS